MGLKRKQMIIRQKAAFEQKLLDRLSFLSGKGIESPKADKDTLVRKWKADIKAANKRLRMIADHEKKTEEISRMKAERAAAPQKEQEVGKGEKPKKAPEEGKGKKTKAPEGGKSRKTTESPEGIKPAVKKKVKETKEEPAAEIKADK